MSAALSTAGERRSSSPIPLAIMRSGVVVIVIFRNAKLAAVFWFFAHTWATTAKKKKTQQRSKMETRWIPVLSAAGWSFKLQHGALRRGAGVLAAGVMCVLMFHVNARDSPLVFSREKSKGRLSGLCLLPLCHPVGLPVGNALRLLPQTLNLVPSFYLIVRPCC